MRFTKDITENDMILAFLRGEIDSPRFGPTYHHFLKEKGLKSDLISNANIQDKQENKLRRALLDDVRGINRKFWLFEGLPVNIKWQKYGLSLGDFKKIKYANFPTWKKLSGGTLLVINGAKNTDSIPTDENANQNIRVVAKNLKTGKTYPEIILVTKNPDSELILFEGHTRATAYLYDQTTFPEELEVIIGFSENLDQWVWY